MSLTVTNPAQVVNNALARLGRTERVGSLLEGSAAAKIALDVYGQTRDDLLRGLDPDWARRDITLTKLKQAPAGGYGAVAWSNAYPPLPWRYQYGYPADCLKVRSLRLTPVFLPDFDPGPVLFSEVNDNSGSPTLKTIVAMIGPVVIGTYTGQITDPTNWDVNFTEAMIDQLAQRMAPKFNPQALQAVAAEGQMAAGVADRIQG